MGRCWRDPYIRYFISRLARGANGARRHCRATASDANAQDLDRNFAYLAHKFRVISVGPASF